MTDKPIPLMKYDPAYGTEKPFPSEANQYRLWHGRVAWLYNPYTGEKRDPYDIGSDVLGFLIDGSQYKTCGYPVR